MSSWKQFGVKVTFCTAGLNNCSWIHCYSIYRIPAPPFKNQDSEIHSGYLEHIQKTLVKAQWCCSVAQSCLTLCDPMDCSMPGFIVLRYLPELAQTHVH